MTLRRGDIVLAPIPFTSGLGGKTRPALVVQADANNSRLADVILAPITSTTRRAASERTQFLVELVTPEGEQSGLIHDSVVRCEVLVTLEQGLIRRKIGRLPPLAMDAVDL